MLPSSLVSLLSLALAASAGSGHPHMLDADDVVVLGRDGSSGVMKASTYEALKHAGAITPGPSPAAAPAPSVLRGATSTYNKARRSCKQSSEVQILSNTSFIDWDVAISPVVSAVGSNNTQISIGDGYSISNQLKIRTKAKHRTISIIKETLQLAYDAKWQTSQENTYRYKISGDMYGVIVSQPLVHRLEGALLSGCTDSPDVEPFEINLYTDQSFGQLHWVTGIIRLCVNETYPIPFCNGEGLHQ
ncbi:uncharacterized protein LY79DRAFT_573875 [Colletotrichum navitas]|uniref:Celp0028 effector like protein n=1 Tax=Colletotrichum navitas TaxID=681940 RepID=A0AAD8UX01_9PEZI|nr:uncharacterized protein LY79DRAFT_573875 [Colletotrichum navitas]KAK1563965.1 hypothetical protein LY79DRAFT_573875 [Colletotrichum navitas]